MDQVKRNSLFPQLTAHLSAQAARSFVLLSKSSTFLSDVILDNQHQAVFVRVKYYWMILCLFCSWYEPCQYKLYTSHYQLFFQKESFYPLNPNVAGLMDVA